jgi:hypothetical protein
LFEKNISRGGRKIGKIIIVVDYGGGLTRSMGGWAAVKSMRKANIFEKSDERILGDGDFVEQCCQRPKSRWSKEIY